MPPASTREIALRDGGSILVRPIDPADKALLAEAFQRLSPESRERRFLTPATHLTEEDLVYLTEVDHNRHEALVALDPETGAIVGVARYVAVPGDREVAEVAVAVGDEWQRRGVATQLMLALSELAHANGVERFRAYVSAENDVVLSALGRAGAERTGGEGAEIEFVVEVPEDGLGERLREALRQAGAGQLRAVGEWARRIGLWRGG